MYIHYLWSKSGKLGVFGLAQCKTISERQSGCRVSAPQSTHYAVRQPRFQTSKVIKRNVVLPKTIRRQHSRGNEAQRERRAHSALFRARGGVGGVVDGRGVERTRCLVPRHMPMRPPNSRLAAVCGEASCQICRISSAADSSNFLHFQEGDSGNRAGCQISLGSKIFRRAGWEKRQILADLICLLLPRWFVGRVGVGGTVVVADRL